MLNLLLLSACNPLALDTAADTAPTDDTAPDTSADGDGSFNGLAEGVLVVPQTGDLGTMHCIGGFVITPENEALGGSATRSYVDGGSDEYDLSGSVEAVRSGNAWAGSWHAVAGFELEFSGDGGIDGDQLRGTFRFVDDDYSVTVELK